MNKNDYKKIIGNDLSLEAIDMIKKQIDNFYSVEDNSNYTEYKIGDDVILKKNALLHGTYLNMDGLLDIAKNGLVASYFTLGRKSKYHYCVGVWNIKEDCKLREYVDFYSGGTIKYNRLIVNDEYSKEFKAEVIPYSKMSSINDYIIKNPSWMWYMEQTKEARFLPSLVQDVVQIGIIFSPQACFLNIDILDFTQIDDELAREFINCEYDVNVFLEGRKNKDSFFTDREKAILFGIPSVLIEGVMVGRKYENDASILKEIKRILPNSYICNLDGVVIA